jgi:hypothetical protein
MWLKSSPCVGLRPKNWRMVMFMAQAGNTKFAVDAIECGSQASKAITNGGVLCGNE